MEDVDREKTQQEDATPAQDWMVKGEFPNLKTALDRGILKEKEFFFEDEPWLISKNPSNMYSDNYDHAMQVDCLAKWLIEFEDHGYSHEKAEAMIREVEALVVPTYSSGFLPYILNTSFGVGYVPEGSLAQQVCDRIMKDPYFPSDFLFDTSAIGLTITPLSDNPALSLYFADHDSHMEEYLHETYYLLEESKRGKDVTFRIEDILTLLYHRCAEFPEFRPIAADLLQHYFNACLRVKDWSKSAPPIPSRYVTPVPRCGQSAEADMERWEQEVLQWKDSLMETYRSVLEGNDVPVPYGFVDPALLHSYALAASSVAVLLFSSLQSGEWDREYQRGKLARHSLLPHTFMGTYFTSLKDIFAHYFLCSEFISRACKEMKLDPGPLLLKQLLD